MLTEQVEQYTKEMEKNTFIIEDLKNELKKDKGNLIFYKYMTLIYHCVSQTVFIKIKLCYATKGF